MKVTMKLGLDVIRSYKRLNYSAWHALAEFVDNSLQSYFNNRKALDKQLQADSESLEIGISYDHRDGLIRVADNSMGMSLPELETALHIGKPPAITSGLSEFGMGLKTAATWIGNTWTVRTKKLGETVEHSVVVNVEKVAAGDSELPYSAKRSKPKDAHYTVIEIRDLNRRFYGRTQKRVKEYLRSMYRQFLRDETATILWQGDPLKWDEDYVFVRARNGKPYMKEFKFTVSRKKVEGWVGVLARGSREKAGFSILHRGRVVRGWPNSWRPESIYGQELGSNNLVNQRLVGEIHLDDFEVSHTKDDIQWEGDDEQKVQDALKKTASDYVTFAQKYRARDVDQRRPSEVEIQSAVAALQEELQTKEFIDSLKLEKVPPPDVIAKGFKPLLEGVDPSEVAFSAKIGDIEVLGYLAYDQSPNDPYVVVEATDEERVLVVINMLHPHINQLAGGMLNYLRDCTYDAIAEWQARHKAATIDPDTIKLLKDRLLRVPAQIDIHAGREEEATVEAS